MTKTSIRLLSLVMALIMLMGLCVSAISVNAADEITVYYRNTKNFSVVSAYFWPKGASKGPHEWPGVAMENLGDNIFKISVPADCDMIIFSNNGSQQTGDLSVAGDNYLFDAGTEKWELYDISKAEPVITSSKKNGASFKTDTLDVTFTVNYADSATYSIDGGAQQSFASSITLTLGAGIAAGQSTTVTVTATNQNGTVTGTYTYNKKEAGVIDGDGSTSPALDGYFATNPDGQVGKQAAITIDGDISDWDSSMLIAQGVANDDPRTYRPSSMHETPVDDYALYAAWDNDNLYLMWEMANVQDEVAPNDDFPLTQGNLWIYNLPVFLYFSIDPSVEGDGTVTDGSTVWNSGITLDANIDTVVAISTNGSNGPFVYGSDDDGKIVYNDTRQSSIKLMWGNETISPNLYGIAEAYGHYNNRAPGDVLEDTSDWTDFYAGTKHKKSLDMFYEMSIPFELLGTSASELTQNGIGLMKVSTFGTSGMNCLPADLSMYDNAPEEYSMDPSSSMEKEDADHITVPLARIGKMLDNQGGSTKPTTPVKPTTPTQPTTPVQPTTPSQPEGDTPTQPVVNPTVPVGAYMLGDSDRDGKVTIIDATMIQRCLAKLISENELNVTAADVDGDKNLSILDATNIQRHLAKLSVDFKIGEIIE